MVKDTKAIHIEISGPVQSGKSSAAASIKEMLEGLGYCVVFPNRSMRNDPPGTIDDSPSHEVAGVDNTVFIITEIVKPA